MAERLIAAGADVNTVLTATGATPLHVAAALDDNTDLVGHLLAAPTLWGVNVARTSDGASPLFVTAFKGNVHVVEQLLAAPDVDVNKVGRCKSTLSNQR